MNSYRNALSLGMVFLSGFSALLYQILWMRQLGLLFGNTSHTAAITLAVFFAGLAGGSWFWGSRAARKSNLLRTYSWLEAGIGATAAFYFFMPDIFHATYPLLYRHLGPDSFLLMLLKVLLAFLLVFPSAFFMGGTVPVMGQFLIRRQDAFGAVAAKLYGMNTAGAVCGAFSAGFVLIVLLGFNLTCLVGISISLSIAALAFILSAKADLAVPALPPDTVSPPPPEREPRTPKRKPARKDRVNTPAAEAVCALDRRAIYAFAFVSGFNVLALEVLWTRLFAQVHENSVYSFSTVLIIVLLCLALGALLASRLAGRTAPPVRTLLILTILSGLSVCVSPFLFMRATGNLQMLPTDSSFAAYVILLFSTAIATIGPPCLLMGTVFPFLMKHEERFAAQPGRSIGVLSAVNTVGAILGSLVAAFVFLEHFGVWRSMQIVTAIYLIAGSLLPAGWNVVCATTRAVALAFLIMTFTWLSPLGLPVTGTTPDRGQETVIETWESSDSTVAVVTNPRDGYAVKINSNYSLGSTAAFMPQIFQSRIPLLLYPETESVFYLGMGTGITAGEALNRNDFRKIREVVACELTPDVVVAARKYFAGGVDGQDFTNGLFKDPRARILIGDGRHYLMAADARFDMINADLFLPYRSGSGSLYSAEHFRAARQRLKPGGVFVQWLPLYQVTEYEFGTIARTMLSAFDQVTLWRNNFQPGAEVVALVGHQDKTALPTCEMDVSAAKEAAVMGATYADMQELLLPINEQTVLFFYCGNVTGSRELFESYPVNTDDRPVIEYGTPRSLHRGKDEASPQFVAAKFAGLVDRLFAATPPQSDPMLSYRSLANRHLPLAGAAFHRAWIGRVSNDTDAWKRNWLIFLQNWLDLL